MLVVKRIVELAGGQVEGALLLSDPDGGELWTFAGREVIEAISLGQHQTVPLALYHLEKLHALGLIDEMALRRLICVVVR